MNETDSVNSEPKNKSDEWKSWPPEAYLSVLLHELRTPITIIKGYVGILSNEQAKEHHAKALESISHAIKMIDDLYEGIADYRTELMKRS
jgi:signal transduction histidine kinase